MLAPTTTLPQEADMQTQHDHSIKVNRAFSLAGIGRYPGSASAMLQAIPPAMIAALTAAQIVHGNVLVVQDAHGSKRGLDAAMFEVADVATTHA